jgi:hypothetical protein
LPPQRLLLAGNKSLDGLVSLVRPLHARILFEIGPYNGLTAWCLSRNLPKATLYTLDIPIDQRRSCHLVGDRGNRQPFARHAYDLLLHEGEVVQ